MHKVFGIGLNKTGTSTLGACCKRFGYRHVSYRTDMLEEFRKGRIENILAETKAFDSFEDWPWALLYKEFYERYGEGARFILTTRKSPEIWLDSLKRHSLNTNPDNPMRPSVYGYKYPHGYEREHLEFYERHNREVREFFAQRAPQLLLQVCWESGDGWEAICHFLGQPIPRDPFPHIRPRIGGDYDSHVREQNEANIRQQLLEIEQRKRAMPRT